MSCGLSAPACRFQRDEWLGGSQSMWLLRFRCGGDNCLRLYNRFVGRQQQGSLHQSRDERKVFLFAHRLVLLQGNLGQVTVAVCGEHPGRHPAFHCQGIGQENDVLAGTFLRTVMRAGTMVDLITEDALQVKRAHHLVTPALERGRDCPDGRFGGPGKSHGSSHFRPPFCAFRQAWASQHR